VFWCFGVLEPSSSPDSRPISARARASAWAALDIHPRVAMQILRHAQISSTIEIYTEVPDEVTRAALKRLGDELSQNGEPQA
jgi:hypothetical protein